MSLAEELRKLQVLHEDGALSDAEFAQAKAALIKNPPAQGAGPPPAGPRNDRDLLGEAAKTWVHFYIVMTVIGLIIAVVFFFAFFLPHWQKIGEKSGGGRNSGGLTLKVDRVEASGGRFLVHMTATNHTKDTLTLPLFGYFFVTDNLGNQYEADPFSSTFPEKVAPAATISGYAVMKRNLNENASKLKVAFTTVFGSFDVKSVAVEDVSVSRAR